MQESAITTALCRLHGELIQAEEWRKQLDVERHSCATRTEHLRKAITALADLLPAPEREQTLLTLIHPQRVGSIPRPRLGKTDLTDAVMELLATHPLTTIKGADMLEHLRLRGLNRTNKCGSRELSRRAKMGIVTRIGFSKYRINIDHPELVRVRAKLATANNSAAFSMP